ncbi:MAG: alkyl hydroperoxide reductase subunit C [Propionibacteriaceae bacterium]|nr:alkyl hydroperoxide reductase subunit C [Propionibacteriaceae bacterium]
MSLIGKEVADFSVQAYHKNDFITVTQADLLGKWSVFVFYPADFTFVCPTELGDLADLYAEFQKIGCEIYSVSADTHWVHKAWHDASDTIKKIHYPMLADPTHVLCRDFEVLIEADGVAERGSFVIGPDGKIAAYEVNGGSVGRSAHELLRRVEASQFVATHDGEVCPANWTPGAQTLAPSLDLVGAL